MKKLLFLLALLLASPAFAQFADQRQYAPTSGGSANIQTVAIPNYNLNVGVVVRFIPGFTKFGTLFTRPALGVPPGDFPLEFIAGN